MLSKIDMQVDWRFLGVLSPGRKLEAYSNWLDLWFNMRAA